MPLILHSAPVKRAKMAAAAGGDWQLAAGHFMPAKWAPVIVAPRTDAEMSAYSRYALAPSDIPWRAPISVSGGAWPFYYELTTAPSGMTIGAQYGDTDYGIMSWASPTVGSHSIVVKVTDQDATEVTRSWTLVVEDKDDTDYFVYCDSVDGSNSNDGSYNAPFLNFLGWYGTTPGASTGSSSVTFPNRQAFYFGGTYRTDAITDPQGAPDRVVWQSGRKPGVHVAIPGETVVFDCTDYYIDTASMVDAAFIGVEFVNGNQVNSGTKHSYWRLDNPSRCMAFETTFGATTGGTTGGTNSACIMFTGLDTSYATISHCTFDNPQGSDFLLNYSVLYIVCEGNVINGYVNESNGHAFYLKSNGARYVSIRNNRGDCSDEFVQIDYNIQATHPNLYDDIEICWNSIISDGAPIRFGGSNGGTVEQTYVYRNSLQGTVDLAHSSEALDIESTPNVIYEKNVMEGVGLAAAAELTVTNDSTTQTDVTGWLNASTNLLEGDGLAYLGTHGAEVA
jgi:hypothetical protein